MAQTRPSPLRWWGRYRKLRRFLVAVAAIPLLQLGPCETAFDQIAGGVTNALPSIGFQAVEGLVLLPIQLVIAYATGSTGGGSSLGGSGSSGSSGLGGFGNSGFGSSSTGI